MPSPCIFCKQPAEIMIRVKKKGEETFSPARPVCMTCFARISSDPRYDVEEVRPSAPTPTQTKRKKRVSLSIPVFCIILALVIAFSSASTAFAMKSIPALKEIEFFEPKTEDEINISVQSDTTEEPSVDEPNETPLPPREDCHFRNARWGDDLETVKLYETEKTEEVDGNLFIFGTSIAGENVNTVMFFDPEFGLYGATYHCYEESRVEEAYLDRYNKLKERLTEKYGKPAEDKKVQLKKSQSFNEAQQLYYGYTKYFAVWYVDDTQIILGAMADSKNYFVDVCIAYSCTTFQPAANTGGL